MSEYETPFGLPKDITAEHALDRQPFEQNGPGAEVRRMPTDYEIRKQLFRMANLELENAERAAQLDPHSNFNKRVEAERENLAQRVKDMLEVQPRNTWRPGRKAPKKT